PVQDALHVAWLRYNTEQGEAGATPGGKLHGRSYHLAIADATERAKQDVLEMHSLASWIGRAELESESRGARADRPSLFRARAAWRYRRPTLRRSGALPLFHRETGPWSECSESESARLHGAVLRYRPWQR